MLTKSIVLAAIAAMTSVNAQNYQGFNYGSTRTDGTGKSQSDFQDEFAAAKKLTGTDGKFTAARLYTMIQATTANDPISAIPAAIQEGTSLLLGIWCSAGQDAVTNEIAALTKAIKQYGDDFTKLVVGLSVGSEDLYRNSPMGIEAKSLPGTNPSDIVNYINQVKQAISGTDLKSVPIGHVDTWTAWVNGSNSEVVDAVDWLGFDAYPYFQSTMPNSIDDANALFWQAYDNTNSASKGKEVWITETGWPVSGKDSNLAKADTPSAQAYWNSVGCQILGNYKTFWYTLRDADPQTPNPSFGLVGANFGQPYYDLSCKGQAKSRQSSSSSASSVSTSAAPSGTKSAANTESTFAIVTSSSSGSGSGSGSTSGSASGATPTGSSGTAGPTTASSGNNSSSAVSSRNLTGAMGLVSLQISTFVGAMVAAAFFAL